MADRLKKYIVYAALSAVLVLPVFEDSAGAQDAQPSPSGLNEPSDVASDAAVSEPQHPQYQALKADHALYSRIVEDGGWKAIPNGDSFELNDQDPRIPALRERLAVEGYVSAPDLGGIIADIAEMTKTSELQGDALTAEIRAHAEKRIITYDTNLSDALKDFQRHHGLEVDGIFGPNTLDALNESALSKRNRIASVMQIWRDYGDMGERYVWANIPSYTVEGWADNSSQISMKSIVGLRSRQTPVFSDEIEYIVTNPRWYAPVSIVRRDKLPKLQKDPSYAARNGYRIYNRASGKRVQAENVNWHAASSAADYQFVQNSGLNNALGELKIIFPNKNAIYLHGTPGKSLFERPQRAFSSGCIRLEDPVAMAKWLAETDNEIDPVALQEAVDSRVLKRIEFTEHTPVHITYMTVTRGDDGKAFFWRDVYHRDVIEQETRIADLSAGTRQDKDFSIDLAG